MNVSCDTLPIIHEPGLNDDDDDAENTVFAHLPKKRGNRQVTVERILPNESAETAHLSSFLRITQKRLRIGPFERNSVALSNKSKSFIAVNTSKFKTYGIFLVGMEDCQGRVVDQLLS